MFFTDEKKSPVALAYFRTADDQRALQHLHFAAETEIKSELEKLRQLLDVEKGELACAQDALQTRNWIVRCFSFAQKMEIKTRQYRVSVLKELIINAKRKLETIQCIIRETALWPSEIVIDVSQRRWVTECAKGLLSFDPAKYQWWNDGIKG